MPSAPRVGVGSVLAGRYQVESELGRGGYSIVYRARDRVVGTMVAIKVLVPPPAGAEVTRERLRREVQAVRGLTHDRIVAVHDLVEDGDRTFIVMECVPGPDLGALVDRDGPITPDMARAIGADIADALSVAHARGILHRDIKPQNILVDPPGRGRLTDFGSARLDGQPSVTNAGAVVGTLAYLAPELLAGSRGDARSDIYSLGLTLFWALTGDLPDRPARLFPPVATNAGFHPRGQNPDVTDSLDRVVARATAAKPSLRFPSAKEMRVALLAQSAAIDCAPLAAECCLLCGGEDPLALGICPRCGGGDGTRADTLLFAADGHDHVSRDHVTRLLSGKVAGEVARRTVAGQRALIRLPRAAATRVVERLGAAGIPLRLQSRARAWAPMPLSYYVMVVAVAAVGTLAGQAFSVLLWLSIPLALALLLAGQWWLQRPALRLPTRQHELPPDVESAVIDALAELPSGGTASALLGDIVQAARSLSPSLSRMDHPVSAEQLHTVVRGACRGALELEALDELLHRHEPRRQGPATPEALQHTLIQVEQTRDRLVQHLLEIVTLLASSQRHAAEGHLADDELASLAGAVDRRARDHGLALAELDSLLDGEHVPA